MAEFMAREANSVPEVALMVDHMIAVETESRKTHTMAVKLREARLARVALECAGVAPGR